MQDSCAEEQSMVKKPGRQPWPCYQPVLAKMLLQLLNEGIGLDHLRDSFLRIKRPLSTEKVTKLSCLITWLSVGLLGNDVLYPVECG